MASDTITVYIANDTVYSESDVTDLYDDLLDESYGPVSIAGFDYDTSSALSEIDPIAYRCGFLDYTDAHYTEVKMPLDIYLSDDDDIRAEWISDNVS